MNRKYTLLIFIFLFFSSFELPNEKKYLSRKIEDIEVFDAQGNHFNLFSLLKEKPLIICPVYTKCQSVCTMLSSRIKTSIEGTNMLGKDFNVISFSFDSSDRESNLKFYEKRWKMDAVHWKTVSASFENIQKFLKSIDFQYDYNSDLQEFNHPSILIVVSPKGRISRYIYGLTPSARDIKLAAYEAQAEKTSPGLFKGFYLKCFAFDPISKTYKLDWGFMISTFAGLLMISIICAIFYHSFISNKST